MSDINPISHSPPLPHPSKRRKTLEITSGSHEDQKLITKSEADSDWSCEDDESVQSSEHWALDGQNAWRNSHKSFGILPTTHRNEKFQSSTEKTDRATFIVAMPCDANSYFVPFTCISSCAHEKWSKGRLPRSLQKPFPESGSKWMLWSYRWP